MKTRLTGATFDASAKTITHASFSDVTLAGIQLITNVTDQIIIYNFADTTKGGTLSTDTLTLEYDTTSMSDTDELMILVEDGTSTQAVSGTVTANLSATDNAVLDAIEADTTTLAGAVSGTEMQVDIVTSALPTGAATSANQTTIIGHVDGIEGLLTTIDADTGTIATEVAGLLTDTELRATPVPISGAVTATDLDIRNLTNTDVVTAELSAVDNAVLDTIAAKDFATQTTLAAINAKLVTGTDIGDVTINNAAGAGAVNIQDGGNTITVDGTVGVSGTVAVTQSGTWDEVGINDSGNSITVDYATTGSGTATGALRVELPTNGTGVIATVGAVTAITNALPAGTNAIGKLSANSGVDIGDVDVISISAGSNLIGDVGIQPRTTNGLDTFMASGSDGSTILVATAQAVKASAGKVYGYYIYNPEAAVTFVHFYNTASGGVTVGTTSPLFTLPIPAGSAANLMSEIGITFGTAITVASTTTAGGNTSPTTGVSATIWFK